MTRVEANRDALSRMRTEYDGPTEDIKANILVDILGVLADISESLAVLADNKIKVDKGAGKQS